MKKDILTKITTQLDKISSLNFQIDCCM